MNSITCPIYEHQDHIGNRDLDKSIHKGFTIGKGKALYWCMTWHNSGHVTVYNANGKTTGRYISGDSIITIHFI